MRQYYQQHFQSDLKRFMPRSDLRYFGHGWNLECSGLENVMPERREQILVCLYFSVLVDQAVYTYLPALYPRFEQLTRYPKFCHGLGQFQKNPRDLLDIPAERGLVTAVALAETIPEGMALFVDEVVDFSTHHMPEFKPVEFFERLIHDPDVEIPLLVVSLDPSIKTSPAWIAYTSLRNAVAAKFATLT